MNDAEAANVRAWLAGDSCSGHRKVTREKGWGGEGAGCRLGAIGRQLLGTFEQRLDLTRVFRCHLAIFRTHQSSWVWPGQARPTSSATPHETHLQQADVIGLGYGLIVGVPDDS